MPSKIEMKTGYAPVGQEKVLVIESTPGLAEQAIPTTYRRLSHPQTQLWTQTILQQSVLQEEELVTQILEQLSSCGATGLIAVFGNQTDADRLIWSRALAMVALRSDAKVYRYVGVESPSAYVTDLPTARHYVERFGAAGSYEVFEQFPPRPEQKSFVASLSIAAFWFILGSIIGALATFIHLIEVDVFGIERLPIGIVFSTAIVGCLVGAARGLSSQKLAATSAMFGICITIILLALYTVGGMLIIQANLAGYAWLLCGIFIPVMIALWPKRDRYAIRVV